MSQPATTGAVSAAGHSTAGSARAPGRGARLTSMVARGMGRVIHPATWASVMVAGSDNVDETARETARRVLALGDLSAVDLFTMYQRGYVLFGRQPDGQLGRRWANYPNRGIIDADSARIPPKLAKLAAKTDCHMVENSDFETVLESCRLGRERTWITDDVAAVYREAAALGVIHSLGAYRDGELAAALWGIRVGPTLGIMSMSHREDSAGHVVLVRLVEQLMAGRWSMIDCGLVNPNFARYGAHEIGTSEFCERIVLGITRSSQPTG